MKLLILCSFKKLSIKVMLEKKVVTNGVKTHMVPHTSHITDTKPSKLANFTGIAKLTSIS